jgi:hypothetical protein
LSSWDGTGKVVPLKTEVFFGEKFRKCGSIMKKSSSGSLPTWEYLAMKRQTTWQRKAVTCTNQVPE